MGIFDIANRKFADMQQRTGDFMTVQKLSAQQRGLQKELERLFTAIGETCYNVRMGKGDASAIDPLMDDVTALKESIAAISAEIDELNNVTRCPGCGDAVSANLNFCPKCGAKLQVEEDTQD